MKRLDKDESIEQGVKSFIIVNLVGLTQINERLCVAGVDSTFCKMAWQFEQQK